MVTLRNTLINQLIPGILLSTLLLLSFMVLQDFLLTLAWAFIITYVVWPPYIQLRSQLNHDATMSAALMTISLATLILLMVYWLVAMLQNELTIAYQSLFAGWHPHHFQLPPSIQRIPWLGRALQQWLDRLTNDRTQALVQIANWLQQWSGEFAHFVSGIGHYLMKFAVILITMFFCFRDGEEAVKQVRQGLVSFLGKYQHVYLQAVAQTTRAVVYGLVLAALGQGLFAGVGYAAAGIEAPVLFGVITALLSMIPMGATMVWLPLSIMLILTERLWQGIGLLLWGLLVVSTVDNLIRPLVICGQGRVPFLVVMFGVLGGLSAFGAIGLFLGPVILAVLLSVWQAWLSLQQDEQDLSPESPTLEATPPLWHQLSVTEALSILDVNQNQGLETAVAEQRRQHHGYNQLNKTLARSIWQLLLAQFKSTLIAVLIVAAIIAASIGDILDGIVILAVVVINASLGLVQEFRAEQSLISLKKMLAPMAKVLRDGQYISLPSEQLVPGDIVAIEAGDKVPADGRLITEYTLEVDESTLTGESLPVAKLIHQLKPSPVSVAERSNMLYMNSTVTRGRANMLVTATGMNTEVGQLANLLSEAEENDTPLQCQLDCLGKRLAWIAITVALLLFSLAIWREEALLQTALTAIALAVAAIPEGLPAVVTITLALGMQQMAKHRAIVKRLAAVETLGCTTVICTDKTGTLTLNHMRVRSISLQDQIYPLCNERQRITVDAPSPAFTELLQALNLCNNSYSQQSMGDPMENALLEFCQENGFDRLSTIEQWPRVAEIPFSAEYKWMATFHQHNDQVRIYIKGAPEALFRLCQQSTEDNNNYLRQNEAMANTGLRVLGMATHNLSVTQFKETNDLFQHIHNLTLLGLIGLIDPPRPEVQQAINQCLQAGIKVKMITGDQKITAAAIANELGIIGEVIDGETLDSLSENELAARIDQINIFARTTPLQKVRIIHALKSQGHVVAMTGDGINDAPALKIADIGIAMGINGTDVAREAASMVLTDNNFATIVKAIELGRGIYANMVKFLKFQLSTNIGAILTVAGAPLLDLPMPFSAAQLLWINIIMDGPPAISLGVDPIHKANMYESPRNSAEPFLSMKRFSHLLLYGLIMGIGTLGILAYGLTTGSHEHALTLAFSTFVWFQIFNVFNARVERTSCINRDFFANRFLWLSLLGVILLQTLAVHWSPAQQIFHTTALTLNDWSLVLCTASSILLLEELRKFILLKFFPLMSKLQG